MQPWEPGSLEWMWDASSGGPSLHARLQNLIAGAGLQLAEVTQVPVVPRRHELAPHLCTYHAVGQGEDVQRGGALLPAGVGGREEEEADG